MEHENREAFGYISNLKGQDKSYAQIKVLAIIEKGVGLKKIDEEEAKKMFPPSGTVFAPSYSKDSPGIHEGDSVKFNFQENQDKVFNPNNDRYVTHQIRKKGICVYKTNDKINDKKFIDGISDFVHDFSSIQNGEFYLSSDSFLFGPFFKETNHDQIVIRPKEGKNVKKWPIKECALYEYQDKIVLFEPNSAAIDGVPIDCMDFKQLFEWFRRKIDGCDAWKQITLELEQKKVKWRKYLLGLINEVKEESVELFEIRINRVIHLFESFESRIELIDKLSAIAPNFEIKRKNVIEEFSQSEKELIQKKLSDKQNELEKLKKQIQKNQVESNDLSSKIDAEKDELKYIEENKSRLIKDFTIFTKALNGNTHYQKSLLFDEILPNGNQSDDSFELRTQIKKYLNYFGYNLDYVDQLMFALNYKGIFVPSVFLALSVCKALNNVTYLIQQVEADWLHFSNFWESGLGQMWERSHQNSNKFHFLILQDINLGCPECWGRPFFDIMNGIRSHFPYSEYLGWPSNFKVFTTVLPEKDPAIGLPLYKKTFSGWFGITELGEVSRDSNDLKEEPETQFYFEPSILQNIQSEEKCENNLEGFFYRK